MTLTPEKKAAIATMLLKKSAYDVGIEFELDKYYKNSATMISTVSKIYNQVKNDPEKFAVSSDLMVQVELAVKARTYKIEGQGERRTLRQIADEKKNKPIAEIALDNRSKASALLNIKLDDLLYNKKARAKVSIGEMAKVYGITFDKGQIVEGKATDHVAMMAKVEGNMSPSEAIDIVLKMREYNQSITEEANQK
jgi:hypothetical protein